MQNKYVGDIGDYGKYGLLRALLPSVRKLGIVWYLVPNESHLNDGKHTDYLTKRKYIDCDRKLFSILKDIVSSGNRNVSKIEQSSIFPGNTVYFRPCLSYDGINANSPTGRQRRISVREQWLGNALEAISDCDVVFLDPDNGLETPSVKIHNAKAPKYVYYNEVKKFLSHTHTLLIYHHLSRNGDHNFQIKQRCKTLSELAGGSYNVMSLRFKPYSPRAYFIVSNQEQVRSRVNDFVRSSWRQCFELVL
ncbi:MAG: hypothetical protein KAS23_03205 [Anaerohalosphaera sp.]|nr:hypothetical protein [Anaerohalosphaera sp.]